MPQLANFTPLPMAFANIPAEQPVRSVAENAQPFTPIDPMAQASRAYSLAGQMNQQDNINSDRADKAVVADYMKNGGNTSTPEGVQKAVTDLSGKLSPKGYQDLMKHAETSINWNAKLNDYYASLPEQAFKTHAVKTETVLKALEGPLQTYTAAAEIDGAPAALPAFESAKQASLQYLGQMKDAAGKPLFSPQDLQRFQAMSPEALDSELRTAKFHMDRQKEAGAIKLQSAQTREHTAKAEMIEGGGADVARLQGIEAAFGKDSPEYKAALDKSRGSNKLPIGVPEDQVGQPERSLAVAQWIQNPSSLRGLDKTYQQNVIKWAAALGITADDVAKGQAQRKFDLASASTSGHRAGQMASVEATMPALIDNALEASAKLPRGTFVPWTKIKQMGQAAFSNPDLREFAIAQQAVESEFQQVISRGGSNVASLNKAHDLVSMADSPETYARAMTMLKKEIAANVQGADKVREKLTPAHGPTAKPTAEQAIPDLQQILKSARQRMEDSKPGTMTYDSAKNDVDMATAEIARLQGGAAQPATPAAAMKVATPEDIKLLRSQGKLKLGDVITGPDGVPRKLKKWPG